jgi:hypothetical protein
MDKVLIVGANPLRLTAGQACSREAPMPQAPAAHHSFIDHVTHHDAEFQFALVLACMLALTLALVYFFPDHTRTDPWNPDAEVHLIGP